MNTEEKQRALELMQKVRSTEVSDFERTFSPFPTSEKKAEKPAPTKIIPKPAKMVAPPKLKPLERSADPVPFSEDALACQFTARHGGTFRYVAKWGKWFQWTGSVWQEENTVLTFDLARRIARDNLDVQGVTEPIKKSLSQASTIAAIVKFASADRQHAARHDQWDTHKMKLNTPGGVIDLTTGELLPHDPQGYHTKITGTAVSNKQPELWLRFLNRIFEDKSIIPYLQRVCGYCLTGNTTEHALFFCYGSGKNGKSTFTRTLSGILGDYCREASLETFVESRTEQHPTGLAALKGARLALIRETEKNSYWAESQLKQCTGGDKVTARYMRQDFFDYVPEFKLLINGNHKPRLRSVDEAIRRRMNLIPFLVTIPETERDPNLYGKLKDEWPEILNWMVEGCLEWQQTGLAAPECVLSATNDYLASEDKLGLWLAERCISGKQESASSTACYLDWKQWCEGIGEHAGSQRAFSQELETREGIRKQQTRTGKVFFGLSLQSDRPEEYQGDKP